MTLPASGPLSIADIAGEFGGSLPHYLSEYYGAANSIPTSGPLDISDFYGAEQLGPVTYVGANSQRSNTVGIPAHQSGDLIVVIAANSTSDVIPSLPSGWTSLATLTSFYGKAARVGYRFAPSSSTTSGTWTNGTNLGCVVYRNVVSVGNVTTDAWSGVSTTQANWPSHTPTDSPGFLLAVGGAFDSSTLSSSPMSSFTNRLHYSDSVPNSTVVVGHDTNGDVASFGGQSDVSTQNGVWLTVILELSQS